LGTGIKFTVIIRIKSMGNLSESTINILLSGLMGFMGGMLTIPINAIINWEFKRKEILLKHKLDMVAKKQEVTLQFMLYMKKSEAESKRAIRGTGNTQ
jgi:hypothetical protein